MAVKKNTEPSRYTSPLHFIATIALITAAVAGIVWLVTNSQIRGWDVRNNLWAPSHLLLNGQSPYDLSSLYELGAAVWLPMAIGAFFPLGALSHEQAAMVWLLTSRSGHSLVGGRSATAVAAFVRAGLANGLLVPSYHSSPTIRAILSPGSTPLPFESTSIAKAVYLAVGPVGCVGSYQTAIRYFRVIRLAHCRLPPGCTKGHTAVCGGHRYLDRLAYATTLSPVSRMDT
jgi:hypothetical protein